MLGSVSDAEDVVQEAFLRRQRVLSRGDKIDSPKACLSAIVTRLSIDQLRHLGPLADVRSLFRRHREQSGTQRVAAGPPGLGLTSEKTRDRRRHEMKIPVTAVNATGTEPAALRTAPAMTTDRPTNGVREAFRPLTSREREILEMLLSAEVAGIAELRSQLAFAQAARWDCGCASFALRIDRARAPRSPLAARPAIQASTKKRHVVDGTFDLLLWVNDGWLSGVEIVDDLDRHGEVSPAEIPPLDVWSEPKASARAT
jgi:DNA-directed RNA polymerase specialized sigma24 family protein